MAPPDDRNLIEVERLLKHRPQAPRSYVGIDNDGQDNSLEIIEPGLVAKSFPGSTAEERSKALSEVFGHPVSNDPLTEERIDDIDREITRLPGTQKTVAIKKALASNPTLLLSSPHAKSIARDTTLSSKEAAVRLAKYWEFRKAMFGDKAFTEGVFTEPTYEDYLRYYDRCLRISSDTSADEESRHGAAEFVKCVNKAKIEAMDYIIDKKATEEDAGALRKAKKLAPHLADTDDVKLSFLRSEEFKELNAAIRMMKYWKMKFMLFEEEIACRNITYDDLNEDDMAMVKCGVQRLMSGADEHGRCIFVNFCSVLMDRDWDTYSLIRSTWYIFHLAMERESLQKHGLVNIVNYRGVSSDLLRRMKEARHLFSVLLLNTLPIKCCCAHVFFEESNWWQKTFMSGLSFAVTKFLKMKIVVHVEGETVDRSSLFLELQKFGLTKEQVPLELGGDSTIEAWCEWLDNQIVFRN